MKWYPVSKLSEVVGQYVVAVTRYDEAVMGWVDVAAGTEVPLLLTDSAAYPTDSLRSWAFAGELLLDFERDAERALAEAAEYDQLQDMNDDGYYQ